jgi:hypothetical protein
MDRCVLLRNCCWFALEKVVVTYRQELIDDGIRALGPALKEKAAKNEHKPPLASLTLEKLRELSDAEYEEITLEEMWVRRFGKDKRAMLLEVADLLIPVFERLRRINAI